MPAAAGDTTAQPKPDHLTPAEKREADAYRARWIEYTDGYNVWKLDRTAWPQCWYTDQPKNGQTPEWGVEEVTIMGWLMNGGWGFSKAWTNVLQYSLVTRTKSASTAVYLLALMACAPNSLQATSERTRHVPLGSCLLVTRTANDTGYNYFLCA